MTIRIQLDDRPLDLFPIHVVVLPHGNRRERQNHNRRRRDTLILLTLRPCMVDCIPGRTAGRVHHLGRRAPQVDSRRIAFQVVREPSEQRLWEGVGVDGPGNRVADRPAETAGQADHGDHHGHAVAVRGRHDGHLVPDHERAAAKGDEDLAHHEIPDLALGAAEVDHEAGAEEHQRGAEIQAGFLEVFGLADPDAEEDGPEGRADAVDLCHVAGVGGVQVVDDLEVVVVVLVPGVIVEENDRSQNAGPEHRPVLEELPLDESGRGEESLPYREDGEEQHADDDHADKGGRGVAAEAVRLEAEGQEKQDKGSHEEKGADEVELAKVMPEGLERRPAAGVPDKHARLLGLALVELEDQRERHKGEEDDDGETAVGPPPRGMGIERLRSERANKGCTDGRGANECVGKCPIAQPGRVRDKDNQDEVDGRVANPVQRVSGCEAIGAIARGDHDNPDDQDPEENQKALGSAPEIEGFGDRQL